jgi:hypothetical protein
LGILIAQRPSLLSSNHSRNLFVTNLLVLGSDSRTA